MLFNNVAGFVATAALAVTIVRTSTLLATASVIAERSASNNVINRRDAYTITASPDNNEGEAHGQLVPPSGSKLTSIKVGNGGEEIAAYWTENPDNAATTHAFIMIHGKLRDGDTYWTTMNDALKNAIADSFPGADEHSIVVAPEFFSKRFNSGQYTSSQLAWPDVNAWQAGDPAIHPDGTTLTSFDALDALIEEFSDQGTYPDMKNITVVGHGGGGQLTQRYSAVAKEAPSNVHIRYIHGDPSSCVYFTTDRPQIDGETLPAKSSCQLYNTWRYGFDNFTSTKTPKEYFTQYITRDVVSLVGFEDTDADGDQFCMALLQGGTKRRDRNLIWWRYINTLARTNEDLDGFPGKFEGDDLPPDWTDVSHGSIKTRLVVVENADHSAAEVFGSKEGRSALFSNGDIEPGFRPSTDRSLVTTSTAVESNTGSAKPSGIADKSNTSGANPMNFDSILFVAPLVAFWTLRLYVSHVY